MSHGNNNNSSTNNNNNNTMSDMKMNHGVNSMESMSKDTDNISNLLNERYRN